MIWLLGTETELGQMIISFLFQDISAHSNLDLSIGGCISISTLDNLNSKSDFFLFTSVKCVNTGSVTTSSTF